MAEERLVTRLELTGEAEYKRALKEINAEQKEYKSELALIDAQYKGNANSAEALKAKLALLEKQQTTQNSKLQAQQKLMAELQTHQEHYTKAAEKARQELAKLAEEGDNTSEAYQAQSKALAEAEKYLEQTEKKMADLRTSSNYTQAALEALNSEIGKQSAYLAEAENSADGCAKSLDEYGNRVKDAKDESSVFADVLAADVVKDGLSKVVEWAQQAGQALVELGNASQEARSTLAKMTGATGEELQELYDSTLEAYRKTPAELQNVAAAAGELNTRLGAVGEDLTDLSQKVADFARLTNTDAVSAVDGLADIIAKWNLRTTDATSVLDMLMYSSQKSGISISTLTSQLTTGAAQLQLYGYNLEQSIGLFTQMQLEGVNASSVLTGLRTAVDKLTKDGQDAATTLREACSTIKSFSSESEAASYAVSIFGARAGTELAKAIRAGVLDVDSLTASMQGAQGALTSTTEAAMTARDRFTMAFNNMKADVAPLVDQLYDMGLNAMPTIQAALEWIGDHLPGVISGVTGLTTAIVAYKIAVAAATIVSEAFGRSLNSSGIGLVVSAVVGLVTVLGSLAITAESTSAEVERLNSSVDSLRESSDKLTTSLEGTAISTLTAAEQAEKYLARLDELEAQTYLTAAEQQEYASIVSTLQSMLPDINFRIDEQTGLLADSTRKIREQITAWKELAISQALSQMATEKFRLATEATQTYLDALALVRQRTKEIQELDEQGKDTRKAWAAFHEAEEAMNSAKETADELYEQALNFSGSIPVITEKIKDASVDSIQDIVTAALSGEYKMEEIAEETGDRTAVKLADSFAERIEDKQSDLETRIGRVWRESVAGAIETVDTFSGSMQKLSDAFAEQQENGTLSYKTMLDVIDAGYASALSIDSETGAVKLDADAFQALATARLAAQIAQEAESAQQARRVALEAERQAAIETAKANHDLAESYLAVAAAQTLEAEGHEAAVAQLEAIAQRIKTVVSGTFGGTGKKGGGGGKTSGPPTQEELYASEKRKLDYRHNMGEVSDAEYYDQLDQLIGQYLTADTEKWMTERVTAHRGRQALATAADRAAAQEKTNAYRADVNSLDYRRDMGEITDTEYYDRLAAIRDQYFEETDDEWRKITVKIKKYQDSTKKSSEEEYSERVSDMKYALDLGVISEQEYYAALKQLRDDFLEEDSEKWRKATVELYNYELKTAKEFYDELDKLAEEYYNKQREAAKTAYDDSTNAIKARAKELVDGYQAQIDAINKLIDARKKERADAKAEDEIAAKRRALQAAKDALSFARTDEDRIQMSREVDRLQKALDEALDDRAYERWVEDQQQQISGLKDMISQAETTARLEQDAAAARYAFETDTIARNAAAYQDYLTASRASSTVQQQYSAATANSRAAQTVNNYTSTHGGTTVNVTVNTQEVSNNIIADVVKRELEASSR